MSLTTRERARGQHWHCQSATLAGQGPQARAGTLHTHTKKKHETHDSERLWFLTIVPAMFSGKAPGIALGVGSTSGSDIVIVWVTK